MRLEGKRENCSDHDPTTKRSISSYMTSLMYLVPARHSRCLYAIRRIIRHSVGPPKSGADQAAEYLQCSSDHYVRRIM